MVGIFSRFSSTRSGHRRTQSSLDQRSEPPSLAGEDASAVTGAAFAEGHGIEVAVEFKPIEHPTEPLDSDQPIQCPLPEPSILNDGRIWKERVCAGERKAELSVVEEAKSNSSESKQISPQSARSRSDRLILPSASAPEHNFVKLLEECDTATSI